MTKLSDDERVELTIRYLREIHNNPELYDLLKIVLKEHMAEVSRLKAQGMKEALKLYWDEPSLNIGRDKILARIQELDPLIAIDAWRDAQ